MDEKTAKLAQSTLQKIRENKEPASGQKLGQRVEATVQQAGEAATRVAIEEVATRAANAVPGGEYAARLALRTRLGQKATDTAASLGGTTARRTFRGVRLWLIAVTAMIVIPWTLIVVMLVGMFLGGGISDMAPPEGVLTEEQQTEYETVGVSPLIAYDSEYTTTLDTVTEIAYQALTDHWVSQYQTDPNSANPQTILNPTVSPNRTGQGVFTEGRFTAGRAAREGPWFYQTDREDCHPAVAAVKLIQYGAAHVPGDCWTLDPAPGEFQPPGLVVEWIERAISTQRKCRGSRPGQRVGCGKALTGAGNDLPSTNEARVLANDFYTLWLAWHNPQKHAPHHYPSDGDYRCAATFYEGRFFPTSPTTRGTVWAEHLKQMGTDGNGGSITDIKAGCADNRLLLLVGVLSARWPMHIINIRTHHGETISGSRVESSHHRGRAFDISAVRETSPQGQTVMRPIRYGTQAGKPLWDFIVYELFLKGRRLGVDQLGSPFPDVENISGVFTDGSHLSHFHIAVCGVRYWDYHKRAKMRDSCQF